MVSFEQPGFLALLFFLPILYFARRYFRKRGGRLLFPYVPFKGQGFNPPAFGIKALLAASSGASWLGAAFLVVALAGPEVVSKETAFTSRGGDVMFVIDASPSMAAKDFPKNRLETAKSIVKSFMKERGNDSAGIVAFGKEAALIVPPTLDADRFGGELEKVSIAEFGDGTALGSGIATAAYHLRNSSAPLKSVIVLTDGESNAGLVSQADAANICLENRIQLFVVGVGSGGEIPISYTDPASGKTYTGTYKSAFDESSLRSLAKAAGGRYFAARDSGELAFAFAEIDSVTRPEERLRTYARVDSRTSLLTMLCSLCFILDWAIRRLFLGAVE